MDDLFPRDANGVLPAIFSGAAVWAHVLGVV
jgi:hypothetical protein